MIVIKEKDKVPFYIIILLALILPNLLIYLVSVDLLPPIKQFSKLFLSIFSLVTVLIPIFLIVNTFKTYKKLHKIINLENQLFYDTCLAINSSSSLKELSNTIVARLVSHLNTDFGLIYILEENLQLATSFNVSEESIEKKYFRFGEGLIGLAAQNGECIISNDVTNDTKYIKSIDGVNSQIAVPLLAHKEILGVLVLGSWAKGAFKEKDIKLIKAISEETGITINNIQLTNKLREEKDHIDILYNTFLQIAANIDKKSIAEVVTNEIHQLTKARSCSLMLSQNKQLELIASKGLSKEAKTINFGLGEGLAGKVFQDKKSMLVKNPENDPQFKTFMSQKDGFKNLYITPLFADDNCIGVINVDTNSILPKETYQLLDAISLQASIALENAFLYKSMEDLAIKDGLIGIYNHRYFQHKLAEEFERAKRYNRDLSLVIFDIDNFKKYNDNFGHMFGDFLLKELCSIVSKQLRKSDILARYGGDEIVIILPETSNEDAYDLMDRLRIEIENYKFNKDKIYDGVKDEEKEDTPLKTKFLKFLKDIGISSFEHVDVQQVTISIGLSFLNPEIANKEDLIIKADEALLEAKKTGKNKVITKGT